MKPGIEYWVVKKGEEHVPFGYFIDGKFYESTPVRAYLGKLNGDRVEYEKGYWLIVKGLTVFDTQSQATYLLLPKETSGPSTSGDSA